MSETFQSGAARGDDILVIVGEWVCNDNFSWNFVVSKKHISRCIKQLGRKVDSFLDKNNGQDGKLASEMAGNKIVILSFALDTQGGICSPACESPPDSYFDAWADLIDREEEALVFNSPLLGGDFPREARFEGISSFEVGEPSAKNSADASPPDFDPLSPCLRIGTLTDGLDVVAYEANFTELPCDIEEESLPIGYAMIDEDDELLNDAPPCCDNLRSLPLDERNMDLKISEDSIYVGRIFASKQNFHKTLFMYAVKRLFSFRVAKSDPGRVIVKCVDPNCSWRVYAIAHQASENFEIHTIHLKHSCDVASRSRYAEKATSKILGELLQPKFSNGKKDPRVCDIPDMMLAEHRVAISITKAWYAKELALASARGNEEESFRLLLTYLHLLKTTNPGTITDMVTTKDKKGNTQFKYLFFVMGASIAGFKYLRKVIVIDGTHMKGKYKGCLVAATCQDGNMQIFPDKEHILAGSWNSPPNQLSFNHSNSSVPSRTFATSNIYSGFEYKFIRPVLGNLSTTNNLCGKFPSSISLLWSPFLRSVIASLLFPLDFPLWVLTFCLLQFNF